MSNHHQLTQHNNSSLRQKKIQEPNSIYPKTDRSSIHQYHITMGSESRRDTRKRNSLRRSKRSTERGNSPHRNISHTGLDSMDKRKTRTKTTRTMRKIYMNSCHKRHNIPQKQVRALTILEEVVHG
jgi:hypothetical protein